MTTELLIKTKKIISEFNAKGYTAAMIAGLTGISIGIACSNKK
jgi:hypothetical protein